MSNQGFSTCSEHSNEVIIVPCKVIENTPRAVLIDHDGNVDHRVWVAHADCDFEINDDGTAQIALIRGLARQRGMVA